MKKNILTAFMATVAAVTMLACEKSPETEDLSGPDKTEDENPSTNPEPEPVPEKNTLLVGTFNIRYVNDDDGYPWSSRRDAVIKFVNYSGLDLLAMQEVCQSQAQYLTENLDKKYGWYEVDRNTGNSILDSSESEGVFVIYDKDRFGLEDHGYFWLAEPCDEFPVKNPDGTYSSWNSALPRVALWLKLADNSHDGRIVYFIGTHYDNWSVKARTGASNLIVKQIIKMLNTSDIKKADEPVFVVGDLNASPNDAELTVLQNMMNEARTTAPVTEESQITFNNYSDTGGYILDHIFYGANVTPEQYDVVTNDYGVKYISDHYPVIFKCSYK